MTIVSPLTAAGEARSRRDPARPVALLEARRRKEATYPELLASARCRLVVIGERSEAAGGQRPPLFSASSRQSPSRAGGPSPCPSKCLCPPMVRLVVRCSFACLC